MSRKYHKTKRSESYLIRKYPFAFDVGENNRGKFFKGVPSRIKNIYSERISKAVYKCDQAKLEADANAVRMLQQTCS